jgi:hypothetical protein
MRKNFVEEIQGTVKIYRHASLDVSNTALLYATPHIDAGIADAQVNMPEPRDGFLNQTPYLQPIGDIRPGRHCLSARRFDLKG